MRRRAALLATVAVTAAGCTHTVSGAWQADPAGGIGGVRPAGAEQVLLRAADISGIVGTNLQLDADRSRPIIGTSAAPACSALDAVGMAAFVGDSWSRFQVRLFTDGGRNEHVVGEAVAVYPEPAAAAAVFSAAAGEARACDGQRALSVGGNAAWSFGVLAIDAAAMRWRKQQIGIPMTWICQGEARLRNNAVLQAMACGADDSGRDTVTRLTDRMSASVWELSDR